MCAGFQDWEAFDALPEPVRHVLSHSGLPYAVDEGLIAVVKRNQAAGIPDEKIAGWLTTILAPATERRTHSRPHRFG